MILSRPSAIHHVVDSLSECKASIRHDYVIRASEKALVGPAGRLILTCPHSLVNLRASNYHVYTQPHPDTLTHTYFLNDDLREELQIKNIQKLSAPLLDQVLIYPTNYKAIIHSSPSKLSGAIDENLAIGIQLFIGLLVKQRACHMR
jgi:hypothetical protein